MKDVSRLYKDNDNGPLKPPPLPSDYVYTSNYCEENIYLLAQSLSNEAETHVSHSWPSLWEAYVVFMSNDEKTVRGHLPPVMLYTGPCVLTWKSPS